MFQIKKEYLAILTFFVLLVLIAALFLIAQKVRTYEIEQGIIQARSLANYYIPQQSMYA